MGQADVAIADLAHTHIFNGGQFRNLASRAAYMRAYIDPTALQSSRVRGVPPLRPANDSGRRGVCCFCAVLRLL